MNHAHNHRDDIYTCPVCDDPKMQERRELVLGLTLFLGFCLFVAGCLVLVWAMEANA